MVISLLVQGTHESIVDLVFEVRTKFSLWKKQDVTLAFVNDDEKEQLDFRRIYFQWFLPTHIHFKEVPLNQSLGKVDRSSYYT